ncbi:MAG TPA: class I SAM-dependent methyltransferase [Cytophagaceae bacterium]|jgi:SAM-dependent methyltransferase|nr:class I SAM-dependent methyltransferase [Cytophagaceae bacterium]
MDAKQAENKEWFGEWFDTVYYHILYSHRDHQEAELFLDNLTAFLQMKEGDKVLDLPCGKGRHSSYLHQKGYIVEGADLSANSISEAKKMEQEGLSFRMHDMREHYPSSDFDYVFNLFTSFGYFTSESENEEAFATLAGAMAPGATLVIDFMNTNKIIRNLVAVEVKQIQGITFTLNKKVNGGFIHKEISFEDKGQQYLFKEKVRELYPADFGSYLSRFGLRLNTEFGDYSLSAYDAFQSDRYIVIATKA